VVSTVLISNVQSAGKRLHPVNYDQLFMVAVDEKALSI
jgi:hypothetical protein